MKHPLLCNVFYTVMVVASSLPGLMWTIVRLSPIYPDVRPLWVVGAWLLVLMVVSRVFYQKLVVARPWFWMLALIGLMYLTIWVGARCDVHILWLLPAWVVLKGYTWLAIDMVVSCGVASCLWLHWCRQDFNTKYYCRLDGWCTRAYQTRPWQAQDRHVFMSYVMLVYHGILVGYFSYILFSSAQHHNVDSATAYVLIMIFFIVYLLMSAIFWLAWSVLADVMRHVWFYCIGIFVLSIALSPFYYPSEKIMTLQAIGFFVVLEVWWIIVMIWQYRKTRCLAKRE